ncbi:hypothetical protein V2A60_005907 [Cordyceps javanica]
MESASGQVAGLDPQGGDSDMLVSQQLEENASAFAPHNDTYEESLTDDGDHGDLSGHTELNATWASAATGEPQQHAPLGQIHGGQQTTSNIAGVVPDSTHALGQVSAARNGSPTFAQELKTLSLEAAAERHLGSTSGFSFAKLTQKVLRRLSPDKADFVFAMNQEDRNGASFFNFTSPSDVFNDNMFQGLSETISVHPLLFGDLFLADMTELNNINIGDLTWPSDEGHVRHLVDFYFAHNHTLYPILAKDEVMQTLNSIQGQPQNLATLSALQNFRLWMVLAIGSTAYSSLSLTEESESMLYYSKALQYFEQSLEQDEMSALEALMLQVSYSFFNQLGPNTWFLVGTAARLALGLGLAVSSAYDAMIYRPSPLSPTSTPERLKILGTAASMSLRQAAAMHQQRRFAYNWLNFLSVFTSTLSLVYAITAQPDELPVVLAQTRAIEDLELTMQLFETFSLKFAAARTIRRMIEEICRRYRDLSDITAANMVA